MDLLFGKDSLFYDKNISCFGGTKTAECLGFLLLSYSSSTECGWMFKSDGQQYFLI